MRREREKYKLTVIDPDFFYGATNPKTIVTAEAVRRGRQMKSGLFVALLKGINVGGTGLLSMKDLSGWCSELGFESVRTYIQSGNVVFASALTEREIASSLEGVLLSRMKKQIHVMVRTQREMNLVFRNNPFKVENPAKVAAAFLPGVPPEGLMKKVIVPGG